MFDPNKNYVTVGKGNITMWQQDGVLYDPSTKQPIDPSTLEKAGKASTSLVCKICGVTRASAAEFKEHLIAAHPENVPELVAPSAPKSAPSAASAPENSQENPKQMTTENIISSPPKRSGRKTKKRR